MSDLEDDAIIYDLSLKLKCTELEAECLIDGSMFTDDFVLTNEFWSVRRQELERKILVARKQLEEESKF